VTTVSADRQSWPWPDSLDALSAAPDHHKLLLENGSVRVLDVRIPAGQFVPVHTHRWASVIFTVSAADFIRRDGPGERPPGHPRNALSFSASGRRVALAGAASFHRERRNLRDSPAQRRIRAFVGQCLAARGLASRIRKSGWRHTRFPVRRVFDIAGAMETLRHRNSREMFRIHLMDVNAHL
jgi:hypothetical protein